MANPVVWIRQFLYKFNIYISLCMLRLISARIATKTERSIYFDQDRVTLNRNQQPTEEQIRQIEEAAKREIVFDEDSPALTPAMEKAFRLAAKNRNTQKKTSVS